MSGGDFIMDLQAYVRLPSPVLHVWPINFSSFKYDKITQNGEILDLFPIYFILHYCAKTICCQVRYTNKSFVCMFEIKQLNKITTIYNKLHIFERHTCRSSLIFMKQLRANSTPTSAKLTQINIEIRTYVTSNDLSRRYDKLYMLV